MGRRTRKRGGLTTRAERDAARRAPAARRSAARERPTAPWGSFPLSELVILVGIVVMIWGFLSGRRGGGAVRRAASRSARVVWPPRLRVLRPMSGG